MLFERLDQYGEQSIVQVSREFGAGDVGAMSQVYLVTVEWIARREPVDGEFHDEDSQEGKGGDRHRRPASALRREQKAGQNERREQIPGDFSAKPRGD